MTKKLNERGYTDAEWEQITVLLYDLSQAYLNGKLDGWEKTVTDLGKFINVREQRFDISNLDIPRGASFMKLDALGINRETAERILDMVFKGETTLSEETAGLLPRE